MEGITLVDAPRSSKALVMVSSPISQIIVKVSRSSHFCGRIAWDSDETTYVASSIGSFYMCKAPLKI